MSKVEYFMEMGGETLITTMDVSTGGGGFDPLPPAGGWTVTQATALRDFWVNGLARYQSNQLALVRIKIGENDFDVTGLGGENADPLPSVNAVLINKVNSGKKGRFFMPGIPEVNVDGAGRVAADYRGLQDGVLATALTTLEGDGIFPAVAQADGIGRIVSAFTTGSIIGTQRRRLPTR